MNRNIILITLLLLMLGCGEMNSRKAEFYGNIFSPDSGFLLTEINHPTGWKQRDCNLCHFLDNVHLVDNVDEFQVDLEEIQTLVEELGLDSCKLCHGTNGL